MKLAEIFEQLSTGELSQVAIADVVDGVIPEQHHKALCGHIRLGLTALYKRFNLKQGQITVNLSTGIYTYYLHSKYAVNGKGSTEPLRWIADTLADPFRDNIIKILSVETQGGFELPLNDYTNELSIATPSLATIRVPEDVVEKVSCLPEWLLTDSLLVKYHANHPDFMPKLGFVDPDRIEIELPMTHLQALLYFVASRVNNPIGMGQEFNAGNNWAAKYEMECKQLENDGNEINDQSSNNRARRNGWV